jgi:hypothetical protein
VTVRHLFLENDGGNQIAGIPILGLDGTWPTAHEGGFPLLQGLDPYGNTVFNRLQAFGLEEELTRLRSTVPAAHRGSIDSALELVHRCQRGTRLYLRFEGD